MLTLIYSKLILQSQVITFNFSYKYRFPTEIEVSQSENLQLSTCAKILGVLISNDLKWSKNTDHITSKARKRIWTLRKLSKMGFDNDFILDVYFKEIRSILEYCAPVWSGGILKKDSLKIENIQKSVLRILLKGQYSSYTQSCENFNIEKLHDRRQKLCERFGLKELSKPNGLFKICPKRSLRNSNCNNITIPKSRTTRHFKSSIPYISRLVNKNLARK